MSESNGLPKGWAEASLADVLQPLDNGKLLHHGWSPQCETHPSPSEDMWGVLKTTAIQDGQFLEEHNKALPSSLEPRPQLEVRGGDLLLTCAGPRSRCGVPCLVRHTRPRLILSGKMYRFRPYDGLLSPAFLEAYLRAKDTQVAIDAMKTGISDSGLNLTHDRFLQLSVPLAPLPEQHRIVERIEELFSDLDAGVASLERAKANLKRYRASVLKSAVEGRLTQDWREEHPQTEDGQMLLDRILLECREKWEKDQLAQFKKKGKEPSKKWQSRYKEPSTPDTSELSELPEGWVWATTEQVCVQVTDGEHNQPRYQEAGMPMLTATHVRNGGVSFEKARLIAQEDYEKARARCAPTPGDVLIVCVGATTGRAGLVGEDHLFALVRSVLLLKPIVAGRYLVLWIDSPWTQAWIRTASGASAQAHFYISDAKRMPIPLPPLAEQEQIVALVEERLSQIDSAEKTIDAELIRSKRLRQSILKRAFEGKLVAQDPNDEPASVLLERIKASREQEQPKKKLKRAKKVREKAK